jgi:hypothetical protein
MYTNDMSSLGKIHYGWVYGFIAQNEKHTSKGASSFPSIRLTKSRIYTVGKYRRNLSNMFSDRAAPFEMHSTGSSAK